LLADQLYQPPILFLNKPENFHLHKTEHLNRNHLMEKEKNPSVAHGMKVVLDAISPFFPREVTPVGATSDGKFGTVTEAMEHYRVSRTTIMTWKRNGVFPIKQPTGKGGHLLIWMDGAK